jgi:hypothetical protein
LSFQNRVSIQSPRKRKDRDANDRDRPDVDYFCDVTYDPFTFMEVNKKVYGASSSLPALYGSLTHTLAPAGWTISLLEWYETVPTLWDATKGSYSFPLSPFPFVRGERIGETYEGREEGS